MMTTLTNIAPTIGKLVRLLGSDQEHEALGAARALKRVLSSAGTDFHALADLIEMTADNPISRMQPTTARAHAVRVMLRACRECSGLLTSKELAFVHSMAKWRGEPTGRQMAWLSSLYERCMKGEHPPC
jgi:hypothetical protein